MKKSLKKLIILILVAVIAIPAIVYAVKVTIDVLKQEETVAAEGLTFQTNKDYYANYKDEGSLYYDRYNASEYLVVIDEGSWSGEELSIPEEATPSLAGDDRLLKVQEIGASAFKGNLDLTKIIIPSTVEHIGDYAFTGCANVEELEIGANVKTIGASAFNGLSKVETLDLRGILIEEIGVGAFSNMSSIESVEIPRTVAQINDNVFNGCTNLATITIADGNESYVMDDGVLYSADMSKLIFYPASDATSYTVDSATTVINGGAFADATHLESVVLPDGLVRIANSAFYGCTALESISIPASVTTIDTYAFMKCSSLATITVDSDNENYTVEDGVLYSADMKKLIQYPVASTATTYELPSTIETIVEGSLAYTKNILAFAVESGNAKYSVSADGLLFEKENTRSFILIQYPLAKTATTIETPASVSGALGARDLVTKIGGWAFAGSDLEEVTISSSVQYIYAFAFEGCEDLTSVTFAKTDVWGNLPELPEGATVRGENRVIVTIPADNAVFLTQTYVGRYFIWQQSIT